MTRVRDCSWVSLLTVVVGISMCGESAAQTAPSVPNLIAYQGRVTLAGGSPVANGTYPATFTLYQVSVGGAALWTEAANVTTLNGNFAHNLGSVTPLPTALTSANDSLWLELTFNSELLTPRTRIVGNAFSLTSNGLEVDDGSGVVGLRTHSTAHQFSQYGSDGGEQVRIWGIGNGEIQLSATDLAVSDPSVLLSSTANNSGILTLRNSSGNIGIHMTAGISPSSATLSMYPEVGGGNITLDPGNVGDATVQVPGNAISSGECLDEPGISGSLVVGGTTIIGTVTLASASLTLPAPGFIVAFSSLELENDHISIVPTSCILGLAEAGGVVALANELRTELPAAAASGRYRSTASLHAVFGPYLPGTKTIDLIATDTVHTFVSRNVRLTLLYVPTVYGSVPPGPMAVAPPRGEQPGPPSLEAQSVDAILTLRQQAEALMRRIDALDGPTATAQPKTVLREPEQ